MRRFFFHTVVDRREHDMVGTILADHVEAQTEAVRLAGALLRDHPGLLVDRPSFCVEVQDEKGQLVFELDIQGSLRASVSEATAKAQVSVIRQICG